MTLQTNRRTFLKAAGATALVVGFDTGGALAAGPESAVINPFVRVEADGTVTVIIKHFEMGQGTTTGLATLVAEEIDAAWDRVTPEFAPADSATYGNLLFGAQGTGGSTAIANSFLQYRQAGATARDLLVRAAAETWGVAPGDVTVADSMLVAGERTAHFGEVAALAATLAPKAEVALKDAAKFRLIGNAALPRKDSAAKTDGSAVFAIDVTLPGMVHAVLIRSPKFGGKLVSFDASAAAELPGFVDAKVYGDSTGVAVYATSTWAAIRARDAVTAEWDFSAAETRSSDQIEAEHIALLDAPEFEARKGADRAATEAALEGAANVVEAQFSLPFLSHAPMEPLNCVIEPTEAGVRFHDGCQFPGLVQPTIAQVLGIPIPNVEVRTVYAGGSFGRRATPTADYQVEAALAFAALGGDRPVKLVWTREDDIRGGYFRPMAAHRARVGLDAEGRVVGWDHRVAVKSILKGTFFEAVMVHGGVDHTSVEGLADTPYGIPGMSVGLSDGAHGVPVLWWRAVGHTHTAYAVESMIDMAAEAAGQDPVAFRLSLLQDGTADQQRLAGVLQLAAEKAGWGAAVPAGRARGVALHKSFNTYVAVIVEVADVDGAVKVAHATCAVDCGVAVNPDVIRAQMEGAIGYGLGAIMRNEVTLTDGEVDQSNFPDYEPLRITDMPSVDVHIVASSEAPTGVGEPATPPAGPALANAIYALTGNRVTTLPMTRSGIVFA